MMKNFEMANKTFVRRQTSKATSKMKYDQAKNNKQINTQNANLI